MLALAFWLLAPSHWTGWRHFKWLIRFVVPHVFLVHRGFTLITNCELCAFFTHSQELLHHRHVHFSAHLGRLWLPTVRVMWGACMGLLLWTDTPDIVLAPSSALAALLHPFYISWCGVQDFHRLDVLNWSARNQKYVDGSAYYPVTVRHSKNRPFLVPDPSVGDKQKFKHWTADTPWQKMLYN